MTSLRPAVLTLAVSALGLLGFGPLSPMGRAAPQFAPVPDSPVPAPSIGDDASAGAGGSTASVPLDPLPDADALARRMVTHQDIYAKVRDAALAGFAKLHPKPAAYDDEVRAELRLLAYLSVWDDYYGEGLWQQYCVHAEHLHNEGASFTVFTTQWRAHVFESRTVDDEPGAERCVNEAIDFNTTTSYPALFKFHAFAMNLQDLLQARAKHKITGLDSTAFAQVPRLVDLAAQTYTQMIREHLPEDVLFNEGSRWLAAANSDEDILDSVSTALDKAFATTAPSDPLAQVLKAEFHTEAAWLARGSGYVNTVTNHGRQVFHAHIDAADKILHAVYAAHPDEPSIPRVMLRVLLDKPYSDGEMEQWFQLGLKLNADTFPIYCAKRWYLLPQWQGYGSERKAWDFGLACAATNDWTHKTPLILLLAEHDPACRNPAFYANGEIWTALEKTFRGYLQQYPDSIEYRTFFVRCAVKGGHWKVATEQLALLGNHWDRGALSPEAYSEISRAITDHRDIAATPSQPAPTAAPQMQGPSPDQPSSAPLPPRD
jgi:hypothetical protein